MKIKISRGLVARAVTKMPNSVSRKFFRTAFVAKKHSPAVLFGVGVLGTVGTVVLACRATLQLNEKLEKIEKRRMEAQQALDIGTEKYTQKDFDREMRLSRAYLANKVVRLYGPTVLLGIASVTALTGSHVMLTKRNAGLLAGLTGLNQAFDSYRKRVIEELGDEKDKEFRHGYQFKQVVDEDENGPVTNVVKRHVGEPEGYARCFDEVNSKMWRPEHMINQNTLRCQQEWANTLLRTKGYLTLNDVLEMLGMAPCNEGARVGWIYENEDINPGDSYIDFGVFKNDIFMGQLFVNGDERSIWLDFNAAPIDDKITLVAKRKRNKR